MNCAGSELRAPHCASPSRWQNSAATAVAAYLWEHVVDCVRRI